MTPQHYVPVAALVSTPMCQRLQSAPYGLSPPFPHPAASPANGGAVKAPSFALLLSQRLLHLRAIHFCKLLMERVSQLSGLCSPFEQQFQPPSQIVHRPIELAHSLRFRSYFHSLKVEAQIIRKLSGAVDTLGG